MKKVGKILSSIMASSMIMMSMAQMMTVSAADEGLLWIEAEDFTVPAGSRYEIQDNEDASGKKVLHVDTTGLEDQTTPSSAQYTFTVENDGEYDIDILSSVINMDYLSRPKWKIDEGEYAQMQNGAVKISYPVFIAQQYDQKMTWYRLGTVNLTAGEHTISILTDETRSFNDFMYHTFDSVVIAPRAIDWKPTGVLKPGDNSYVMKNATDYSEAVGYDKKDDNMLMGIIGGAQADPQPKLTYNFKLDNTDYYDIWVDTMSYEWYSDFISWKIDTGTVTRNRAAANSKPTIENYMGWGLDVSWIKVGSASIRKGEHSLELDAIFNSGESRYISLINRVAIVPSSWGWTPNMALSPKKMNSKIIWGESESLNVGTDLIQREHDSNASSGALTFVNGALAEGTSISSDYGFTVETAGDYTVYALGTPGSENWLSPYKCGIDGSVTSVKDNPEYTVYWGEFQSAYEHNAVPIYWQKVCDISNLTEGKHTLTFVCDSSREADSNYVFGLDMFAIVPKNDAIDLNKKSVAEGIAELQASTFNIPDTATENIELPTKLGRDTTVVWSSDNPDVISNNGTIVIPEESTEVTLTATFKIINKGAEMTSKDENDEVIPVTKEYKVMVPASAPAESFAFTPESSIAAGSTVEAFANVEETGDIVLYTAIFDGQDRLVAVSMDTTTSEKRNLRASVQLPDSDVTGYKAKAFLWTPEQVPVKNAIELE